MSMVNDGTGNFKPKKSKYANQVKEERSIRCLEELLDKSMKFKSYLSKNDKSSNIDGYIEILEDSRPCGKVTVQVKTLRRRFYKTPKFDCPTSLFGYAKNIPTELVLLIAVNNENKIAYWKHISRQLIEENVAKLEQQTITLNYFDEECIKENNLDELAEKWQSLFKSLTQLLHINYQNNEKINELNKILENNHYKSLSIEKNYIIQIQRFIDYYNDLLDNEFYTVKNRFFKDVWKVGLAFSKFDNNELAMVFFNIRQGENDLLIKQVRFIGDQQFNSSRYALHSAENKIIEDPEKFALELILKDINDIFSGSTLFLTEETATEYIFDFIDRRGNDLSIEKQTDWYDLSDLRTEMEIKYPYIGKMSCSVIKNNLPISLNGLYDSVIFLLNKSLKKVNRLYPQRLEYWIKNQLSSMDSSRLAYEKMKFAYSKLSYLFDAFMLSYFPSLHNIITFLGDCDLLLVNLGYDDNSKDFHNHYIRLYYFKSRTKLSIKKTYMSMNFETEIFNLNNIESEKELISKCWEKNQPIIYNGNEFDLLKCDGERNREFDSDFYIHSLLFNHLKAKFTQYFKEYLQL